MLTQRVIHGVELAVRAYDGLPETGIVLNMQMDGASVAEIAAALGCTVTAKKELLWQCILNRSSQITLNYFITDSS